MGRVGKHIGYEVNRSYTGQESIRMGMCVYEPVGISIFLVTIYLLCMCSVKD